MIRNASPTRVRRRILWLGLWTVPWIPSGCQLLTSPQEDPRLEEVTYQAVTAGGTLSCGLSLQGGAYCWGSNAFGQLGGGRSLALFPFFHPVPVSDPHAFKSISAALNHACGIDEDGRAFCWGSNRRGELGIGEDPAPNTCAGTPCAPNPTQVAGAAAFEAVDAELWHTCGLTRDGAIHCWGANTHGQLGSDTEADSPVPARVRTDEDVQFIGVSVGLFHTCALAEDGSVLCWGSNDYGQLGAEARAACRDGGPSTCAPAPVRAAEGFHFRSLSAGHDHTCGLTADGEAYCWGHNHTGQLGVPPDSTLERCGDRSEVYTCSSRPVRVAGNLQFIQISAGRHHTCALTPAGLAYCWGRNETGTLGACVIRAYNPEPLPVCGGQRFVTLSGGSGHHCGVSQEGRVYCWGSNSHGQLGSTTATAFGPVRVVRPRRASPDDS